MSLQHTTITIDVTTADGVQEDHVLYTCVYPCTLVNFQWVIQMRNNKLTAPGFAKVRYFLIKVLEGQSPSTISPTNKTESYSPGNNVIFAGYRCMNAPSNRTETTWPDEQENNFDLYRMKVGDTLRIVMKGIGEVVQGILGHVKFDIVT